MGPCPQTSARRPSSHGTGYPPLSTLRRSRTDRKIAGVSGGIGRYAGIDPLIVRILFVVLAVFGGSGLLLYALGWLLVPEDGETESEGERLFHGRSNSSLSTVLAIVVVLVVGLAATGTLLDSGPGLGGLGVLIVVSVLVVLLLRNGYRPPVARRPRPSSRPRRPPSRVPTARRRAPPTRRPPRTRRWRRRRRRTHRPRRSRRRPVAPATRSTRRRRLRRRRPRRQGAVDPGSRHAVHRPDRRGAARSAGTRPPTRTCRLGSSSPRRWPSSVAGCWSARSSDGLAGSSWSVSCSCCSRRSPRSPACRCAVASATGPGTRRPSVSCARSTSSGSARRPSTCRPST